MIKVCIVLILLLSSFIVVSLIFQKTQFEKIRVHKPEITFEIHDIDTLNLVWNENPEEHINDYNGYKNCLLFLHYFDPVMDMDDLLDIKSNVSLRDLFESSFFKYIIPPVNFHTDAISFCTYNKFLNFKHYYFKEGGIGFVFCYKYVTDFSVSPLCFYSEDGATLMRSNGGCGNVGLQIPLKFDKTGYGSKHIYNTAFTSNALSFKEFIQDTHINTGKTRDQSSLFSHNEVVIKSWYGLKHVKLPLSALFITKNKVNDANMIQKLQNFVTKIFNKTGETIPIMMFDCDPVDGLPFKYM